jgi:CheY-like chemotaxis protein
MSEGTRAIPVVAVTASVMQPQRAEALEAGFDAIEPKPVNVRALLATIRRLVPRQPLAEVP